jgi:hypothetical protein
MTEVENLADPLKLRVLQSRRVAIDEFGSSRSDRWIPTSPCQRESIAFRFTADLLVQLPRSR